MNSLNERPPSIDSKRYQLDWPLILFFVLAYAIAWAVLGILTLVARESGLESGLELLSRGEVWQLEGLDLALPDWSIYLLTRLADFAFSIAGIIMIAALSGVEGLKELGRRLFKTKFAKRYYLIGLLPLLLYLVATVVSGQLGSFQLSGTAVGQILFSLEAGLLVSLFLRGAFGEEFGLRGFALPRLQARMSPFRASMWIGLLWGAWHLPVLVGRDPVSIIAFIILSFGLSFIFTWLFNGSGGSLIPVLLFHATQNWEEGFEGLFPGLVGTEWELVSTLLLLLVGIVAGVLVWRQGNVKMAI